MNRLTFATMLAGVTTLSFTVSAGSMEEKLAIGKHEYEAKCAICHGVTGKGDGPFTNQLKMPSTDLTQLAKHNDGVFPETEVYMALDGRSEVQAHGPREMPIYGNVYLAEGPEGTAAKEREPYVDKRLRALIAYLETIQSDSPVAADQVAMGKLEYEAKCAICHGVTGKGDGPFTNQLKMPSTDLTQLAKHNDGVFPETEVYMALDGRSEVQAHGPREMPIYGNVYLAEGPEDTTAKEREPYVDSRLRALIAYMKTMQK